MITWVFKSKEGPCIDEIFSEKIGHAYFDISAGNIRLQEIMKENTHPQSVASMKTSKINSEIECGHHFQNNTFFVMTNEKDPLFFLKLRDETISILSNIAIIAILSVLLLASDSNSSEGSLDHVKLSNPALME